jgi:hypothetical protein
MLPVTLNPRDYLPSSRNEYQKQKKKKNASGEYSVAGA